MRVIMIAAALAAAGACSKSDAASVPALTVDEVARQLAANECQPVDANGDSTRKKLGVLPGRSCSPTPTDFKPASCRPTRRRELVFYCANTHCGASHHAAEKAILAVTRTSR